MDLCSTWMFICTLFFRFVDHFKLSLTSGHQTESLTIDVFLFLGDKEPKPAYFNVFNMLRSIYLFGENVTWDSDLIISLDVKQK